MQTSKLSVTVDDKLMAQTDWSGHPNLTERGAIGIGAGGAEVHFDNFVITGDEVPDAGPSGFAVTPNGKLVTVWGMKITVTLLKIDENLSNSSKRVKM